MTNPSDSHDIIAPDAVVLLEDGKAPSVVDLRKEPGLGLSANRAVFHPAQEPSLLSEEEEGYITELGPAYFQEKQQLADDIKKLEQKKAIHIKLLEQFEARKAAWLKKYESEHIDLSNLLDKDIEKRHALIDDIKKHIIAKRIEENELHIAFVAKQVNKDIEERTALIDNIEKRIEENRLCINFIVTKEDKLAKLPAIFAAAHNPINPELVTFAPPKNNEASRLSNNKHAFFAFKPKIPSMAADKLVPSSNHIPTIA
jgi:hypothetical protein